MAAPELAAPSAAAANARVARQLARNEVLDAAARAMDQLLGLRLTLLARPTGGGGRLSLLALRDNGAWPRPARVQPDAMLALAQAGWPVVVGTLGPLVVADAHWQPLLAGLAARTALGVRGYAAVPVVAPDGSCWGMLCGMDWRAASGTAAEAGLVQVLARLLPVQSEREGAARERGVRLVAMTAQHELNNALGKVYLRAQLLEDEPDLAPRARVASATLQEVVGQLAAALRQLRAARPGSAAWSGD